MTTEGVFLPTGTYRHYKHGLLYTVHAVAFGVHGMGLMVVYQAQYAEKAWYVRDFKQFIEEVELPGGSKVQRFTRVIRRD